MGGVHISPFPHPTHFGWSVEDATDFALKQLDYIFQTVSAPADTAAFIVEPVLGEGGYVPANARFFAGLRERATGTASCSSSTRYRPATDVPASSGAATTSAQHPT